MRSIEWSYSQWPWVTLNLDFKVMIFWMSSNSKMVQDRAIVTTADQYKVVYDLSIGAIFNDLGWPLTQISRARHYSTFNISVISLHCIEVHRVHIKRCHWFFHNNFYKYARIFIIFGTQLIILVNLLVNLLRCVPCTPLTWWRNVDVTEITPFTVHVTLSPCCRERRQEFIPPEMWPPNSPDLNPVDECAIWGILQKRVYRSQIYDVKELKERLLSEWKLLDHTIIVAVIA